MNFIKICIPFLLVFSLYAKPVDINFQDLDISNFVKMVSKITNKNILLSTAVPGKVNFVSAKPIDQSEVYDLLLSVLRTKGFTLVDSGNGFLEVVRSSDALSISPALRDETDIKQIHTDIIPILYSDAALVLPQVKFLQSKYGKGILSAKTNSIVLSDYPKNLKVIRKLIKSIDAKEKNSVKFIKLKHALSAAVLPKLTKIVSMMYNAKIDNQKVEILHDEGSNTLIVIAKETQFEKILEYIKELDKQDQVAQQMISIISLKNSDAQAVAKTLELIVAGKEYKKDESKPKITFDNETNSLIVISSQSELAQLKTVLNTLDTDRQQVFVRARIIEINNDKASQIGAKYGIFGGVANSSGLYTFSSNIGGSAIPITLGDIGIDIPDITKGLALGATISLLNTNGAADILSEPSLLCINNLESSIYVGRTESIISEGSVDASVTDVTKNTYTRQDIGLTLTLKPRISTDNKVTLDVKTVLEDVVPGSQAGLPTTTKREIKTTAIVSNGESIIIGGLLKEKQDSDITKIPFFGDIPVLGELFQHESKSIDKVSLVVILTPYIVSKSTDLGKLREALGKLSNLESKFALDFEKKAEKKK